MRIKKYMAVLMAVMILMGTLTGCVGNTSSANETSISYISDPTGMETSSREDVEDAMNQIGEYYEFKRHIYGVSNLDEVKDVAQKAVKDGASLYIGTCYSVNHELLNNFDDTKSTRLAMIGSNIETEKRNVTSISFKMEEAAFLAGYMAAMVSTTKTVGYIGGFDTDYTEQYAGFYAGAKYYDANVNVVSAYTSSYNNSVKGKSAAEEVKSKGADVFYVNCGSSALGVANLVKDSEVKLILSDMYYLESNEVIAQAKKYVKNAALHVVDEYLNNELYSGSFSYGISYGFVDLLVIDGDDSLKEDVAELRNNIRTSKVKVPSTMADAEIFLQQQAQKAVNSAQSEAAQ